MTALAAALAIGLMVGVGIAYLRRPPPETNVYRSTFVPPANLVGRPDERLSISPDGRRLAFVAPDANGVSLVWIRALDGLVAEPLAGTFQSVGSRWNAGSSDRT
jgi:hypothetical protein